MSCLIDETNAFVQWSQNDKCSKCSKDLSEVKFLAISAGLLHFPLCSINCFDEFNVACASPKGPCDFREGNTDTCLFITNVGFSFEVRQEAEAFSQVFGSLFYIKTRQGNSLQNWLYPGTDSKELEENKSVLAQLKKNLESYEELKVYDAKISFETVPLQRSIDSPPPPPSTPQTHSPTNTPEGTPPQVNGEWLNNPDVSVEY
jgi:hypothetical protein